MNNQEVSKLEDAQKLSAGCRQVQLAGKYSHFFMLVDERDYEEVSTYSWHGYPSKNGIIYARTFIQPWGFWLSAHRMITNAHGTDFQVDHANHNGLDNRRANLRVCANQHNQQNRRKIKKGSSRFKGVSWDKQSNRWKARIRIKGKDRCLGLFKSEVEAAKAYNEAAKIHFKQFACPNRLRKSNPSPTPAPGEKK